MYFSSSVKQIMVSPFIIDSVPSLTLLAHYDLFFSDGRYLDKNQRENYVEKALKKLYEENLEERQSLIQFLHHTWKCSQLSRFHA